MAINPTQIARGGFSLFGLLWKYKLLSFFTIFILLNAIFIGIQTKSIEEPIKIIGSKVLKPTQSISEESREIIANGGIAIEGNTFEKIITFLTTYSKLILSLIILYLWIKLITKIIFFFGGTQIPLSIALIVAIIFVLSSQSILILALASDQGLVTPEKDAYWWIGTPIRCFKDFFQALPYILSPVADIGSSIGDDLDSTNISTISNKSPP